MHDGLALLLVAGAGATGSLMRYGVTRLYERCGRQPHHATLTVNLLGALLLGLLIGGAPASGHGTLYLAVGGSLLGGFTTWSTLMLQLAGMTEQRAYRRLRAYAAQTFLIGLPLAGIGWWAGMWLAGG